MNESHDENETLDTTARTVAYNEAPVTALPSDTTVNSAIVNAAAPEIPTQSAELNPEGTNAAELDEVSSIESENHSITSLSSEPTPITTQPLDNDHYTNDIPHPSEPKNIPISDHNVKTKRHSKRRLIFLLACIIAVLSAVDVFGVYKLFFESQAPITKISSVSSAPNSSTVESTLSAATLIDDIKSQLKSTVLSTQVGTDGMIVTADNQKASWMVANYQPNGYAYSTNPDAQYGISAVSNNADTERADFGTIAGLLTTKGLSAAQTAFSSSNSNTSLRTVEYFNTNTLCLLDEAIESHTAGNYQVNIGCADISSYISHAKTLKPIYDTYVSANPSIKNNPGIDFNIYTITQSKTSGYRYAQAYVADVLSPVDSSRAWFYQTPNKSWTYFTNTQNVISCSAYNTADLRNAFSGMTCFNGSTQSTVTP